jgi:thymidylate kinase
VIRIPLGYIILAGPQAAGKSTTMNYISCKFQSLVSPENAQEFGDRIPRYAPNGCGKLPTNLVILQEMRQIVLREHFVPGGIFMDWAGESEIIDRDLERLDSIIAKKDKRVYVDETDFFTLAHAKFHNINTKPCLEEYMQRLENMNPLIVFLEVSPDTSWQRRKPKYEERVADLPAAVKAKALTGYRGYLNKIYHELHYIYDSLALPKVMINTEKPLEDALEEVSSQIQKTAVESGIDLIARI